MRQTSNCPEGLVCFTLASFADVVLMLENDRAWMTKAVRSCGVAGGS